MYPLVSIIIPFYNNLHTINETVESCLSSSYENIETIIVDDGSNLCLESLINPQFLTQIKILKKENGGVSSARNYGVNHSQGKYILFVDADDLIDKSYVEKCVDIFKTDESINIITCRSKKFSQNGSELNWELQDPSYRDLLIANHIMISSMLQRKHFNMIGGFDETLTAFEDWDFWIRISSLNKNIYLIDEYLFKYRVDQENHISLSDKYYYVDNDILKKHYDTIYIKNSKLIVQEFGHPTIYINKINRFLSKPWYKRIFPKKYLTK